MKRRGSKKELVVLASYLEIDEEFLRDCVERGALNLEEFPADPRAASPAQLARLRRLQRLCGGLDLDVFAGSIIVELLERLDSLRRDLELLRRSGL
jgi:hypothetical protein